MKSIWFSLKKIQQKNFFKLFKHKNRPEIALWSTLHIICIFISAVDESDNHILHPEAQYKYHHSLLPISNGELNHTADYPLLFVPEEKDLMATLQVPTSYYLQGMAHEYQGM